MTTVSRSQVATVRDAGDGLAVGRQVFRSHLEITGNNVGTRNLAIANSSRISSTHIVTIVNFQREVFHEGVFFKKTPS